MSSANRRRISGTGALPGRKPGTRATRANSLAPRFPPPSVTSSAGISSSSSRRQVASAASAIKNPSPKLNSIQTNVAQTANSHQGMFSLLAPGHAKIRPANPHAKIQSSGLLRTPQEEPNLARTHPASRYASIWDAQPTVNSTPGEVVGYFEIGVQGVHNDAVVRSGRLPGDARLPD